MSGLLINGGKIGKYSLKMVIVATTITDGVGYVTLRAMVIDDEGEREVEEINLNVGDSYQFDINPTEKALLH